MNPENTPASAADTGTTGLTRYIAFAGDRRVASGEMSQVALAVKRSVEANPWTSVLIFDATTSARIEWDLRGTEAEVLARLQSVVETAPASASDTGGSEGRPGSSGPGRPKLGVVAREVTLLPRHWDWLNGQPGGASVALRKLVEEARRASAEKDRIRLAQDAAYRFLSAVAGNLPNFEEATRALFAGDSKQFDTQIADWPGDIRDHARHLAAAVFMRSPHE